MNHTTLARYIGAALWLLPACSRSTEASGNPGADVKHAPSAEPAARSAPPAPSVDAPPAPSVDAPPAAAAHPAPRGDYLSLSWARDHKSREAAALAESARLEALGHELYRKHQDAAALPQYEGALAVAATGSLYYKYGNSLSNLARLDDAIHAYAIALELGYDHAEAVHYNTACALSRKGDIDGAHAKLIEAVTAGYSATQKLQTDPDLANLRARPDWAARYAVLHPTVEALVGEYRYFDVRDIRDFYTLCPNNQVVVNRKSSVDGSCCGGEEYGNLRQQGHDFVVDWYVQCGRAGSGKKESTENWPDVPCQPYSGCTQQVTCRATHAEPTKLFSDKELPTIARTAFPKDYEPGEGFYVPGATNQERCARVAELAPKYRPKAAAR